MLGYLLPHNSLETLSSSWSCEGAGHADLLGRVCLPLKKGLGSNVMVLVSDMSLLSSCCLSVPLPTYKGQGPVTALSLISTLSLPLQQS